jgi:hypothetical protein
VNGEKVEKPIYRKKHRFTSGEHEITVNTRTMPTKVGIDGLYKLIDKDIWNNIKNVDSDLLENETILDADVTR